MHSIRNGVAVRKLLSYSFSFLWWSDSHSINLFISLFLSLFALLSSQLGKIHCFILKWLFVCILDLTLGCILKIIINCIFYFLLVLLWLLEFVFPSTVSVLSSALFGLTFLLSSRSDPAKILDCVLGFKLSFPLFQVFY